MRVRFTPGCLPTLAPQKRRDPLTADKHATSRNSGILQFSHFLLHLTRMRKNDIAQHTPHSAKTAASNGKEADSLLSLLFSSVVAGLNR